MTPDQIRQLVSGYATNTLSEQERERLFALALEDQELFDELMREQPLVELLADPDARDELMESLSPQLAVVGSRARAAVAAAAPAPMSDAPLTKRTHTSTWWMAAAACAGLVLIGVGLDRSTSGTAVNVSQNVKDSPAIAAPQSAESAEPAPAKAASKTSAASPQPAPGKVPPPSAPAANTLADQQKLAAPEDPLDAVKIEAVKKRKNEAIAEADRLSGSVAVNGPPPARPAAPPPPPPPAPVTESARLQANRVGEERKETAAAPAQAVGALAPDAFRGGAVADQGTLIQRQRVATGPNLTVRLFLASGQPLAANALVPAGAKIRIVLDATAPVLVRINNGPELAFGPSTLEQTLTVDRTTTLQLDARLAGSAPGSAGSRLDRDKADATTARRTAPVSTSDRVILPLDSQPVQYQWTLRVASN